MIPEKEIPEGSEVVDKAVIRKGKLGWSWVNPTSKRMKVICQTIIFSNTGLVTLVSGSDLFTGYQSKAICFVLGAMGLIAGSLMKVTGVNPIEE